MAQSLRQRAQGVGQAVGGFGRRHGNLEMATAGAGILLDPGVRRRTGIVAARQGGEELAADLDERPPGISQRRGCRGQSGRRGCGFARAG